MLRCSTRPATGSPANLQARSDVGSPSFTAFGHESTELCDSLTCSAVAGLTGSAESATDGRKA